MQLNEGGKTHNANMTTNLKEAFSAVTYHTSLFTLNYFTPHPLSSNPQPFLHSNFLFEEKIKKIRKAFPHVPPLYLATFYLCFHHSYLSIIEEQSIYLRPASPTH